MGKIYKRTVVYNNSIHLSALPCLQRRFLHDAELELNAAAKCLPAFLSALERKDLAPQVPNDLVFPFDHGHALGLDLGDLLIKMAGNRKQNY